MSTDETTTHAEAGPIGRGMADSLIEKVADIIDGFPASDDRQRAAIARLVADGLYDRYDARRGEEV